MEATTFNVLMKDGFKTAVAEVRSITRTDEIWYAGRTYRNTFNAVTLGRPIPEDPVKVQLSNSSVTVPVTVTASTGASGATVVVSDAAAVDMLEAQAVMPTAVDTYVAKSDDYTATEPRHQALKASVVRMWSDESFQDSVTLATGSRTGTMVSTASVVVGQQLIGTGIPDGAVVLSVPNATTFVMSIAATATGAETVLFASGQMLFESERSRIELISVGEITEV